MSSLFGTHAVRRGSRKGAPFLLCLEYGGRVEWIWILIPALLIFGPIVWGLFSRRGRDAAPEHDDAIPDPLNVRRDGRM